MKLFKTDNIDIIISCQEQLYFNLPSNLLLTRSKKLENCEYVRSKSSYFKIGFCYVIYRCHVFGKKRDSQDEMHV